MGDRHETEGVFCLAGLAVPALHADQEEGRLLGDASGDPTPVPLDVPFSLVTSHAIQYPGDNEGEAAQTVMVAEGVFLHRGE